MFCNFFFCIVCQFRKSLVRSCWNALETCPPFYCVRTILLLHLPYISYILWLKLKNFNEITNFSVLLFSFCDSNYANILRAKLEYFQKEASGKLSTTNVSLIFLKHNQACKNVEWLSVCFPIGPTTFCSHWQLWIRMLQIKTRNLWVHHACTNWGLSL